MIWRCENDELTLFSADEELDEEAAEVSPLAGTTGRSAPFEVPVEVASTFLFFESGDSGFCVEGSADTAEATGEDGRFCVGCPAGQDISYLLYGHTQTFRTIRLGTAN